MSNVVSPNFPNGPLQIVSAGQPSALQQLVEENVLPPTYQVLEGFLNVGPVSSFTGAGYVSSMPAGTGAYAVVDKNGNYLLLPLGQQVIAMSIAVTSSIVGGNAAASVIQAGFIGYTINPVNNVISLNSPAGTISTQLPSVALATVAALTSDPALSGSVATVQPASSVLANPAHSYVSAITLTSGGSAGYAVAIVTTAALTAPITAGAFRVLVTVI
jgi:hypothetical protein